VRSKFVIIDARFSHSFFFPLSFFLFLSLAFFLSVSFSKVSFLNLVYLPTGLEWIGCVQNDEGERERERERERKIE
jgi:hypothetical protein